MDCSAYFKPPTQKRLSASWYTSRLQCILENCNRKRGESQHSLLESDDPRIAERGLQALHAIESERRKLAELELAHAKAGMEALVFHHLGRLRLQPEAGD